MTISGNARVAGVIGWPVGHSLSPRLHGYWISAYRIDGAYVPFAVSPDHLPEAIRSVAALGLVGINVTVPHKTAVLELVDVCDDSARRIGAINTIVVGPDGALRGSNTDGFGFLESLRQEAPGWDATGGPAVVIGAGGAARAICVALQDAGAPDVRVVNRTEARAAQLVEEFGAPLRKTSWNDRAAALDGAALLVNTTTLGMHGQPALDLALDALPDSAVVTDIVYVPLETPLLRAARTRGNRIVDGLGMLLHQARPGFAAWFGREPEVTAELRAHLLRAIR
jgi:shikimate dehydrogenase